MANSDTFKAFRVKHGAAVNAGLIGAAALYRGAVMRKLAGGYTSGKYKRGHVMNSVTMGRPGVSPKGDAAINVGTNVPYAAFWEFGFRMRIWSWYSESLGRWFSNPKSPTRFVRVEHWRHAMVESGGAMSAAFNRAYVTRLRAGA